MFQFIIDIVKFKINRVKVQIFLKLTKNIFILVVKMMGVGLVMILVLEVMLGIVMGMVGVVLWMIEIIIEGEVVGLALVLLLVFVVGVLVGGCWG